MSEPYIGEIRAFATNFAPKNWALCNGQLLSIQTNQALFALLGTTYGGNGVQTFALPDLRGRLPIGQGQGPGLQNRALGEAAGEEAHTLLATEMPQHSHTLNGATGGTAQAAPSATAMLGASAPAPVYAASVSSATQLASTAIGSAGGSQAHPNIQPVSVLSFCIALAGVFPSRN